MLLERVQSQIKAHLSLWFLCQRRKKQGMWGWWGRRGVGKGCQGKDRSGCLGQMVPGHLLQRDCHTQWGQRVQGWQDCRATRVQTSQGRLCSAKYKLSGPGWVTFGLDGKEFTFGSHFQGSQARHLITWILGFLFSQMGQIVPTSWDCWEKSRRLEESGKCLTAIQ